MATASELIVSDVSLTCRVRTAKPLALRPGQFAYRQPQIRGPQPTSGIPLPSGERTLPTSAMSQSNAVRKSVVGVDPADQELDFAAIDFALQKGFFGGADIFGDVDKPGAR